MAKNTFDDSITRNLDKYKEFLSWARWYPDLYLEYFRDPDVTKSGGSIVLNYDQRVFLRCDVRFRGMSGCFSRGYSKTYSEVLADFLTLTLYPNVTIALTAQTKENAAKLIKQKSKEILRHFPLFEQEIERKVLTKNEAEIVFKNGSIYKALANSQNVKGERAHRLRNEESALMDAETYDDAVKPVVEVPRVLAGKAHVANPEEMNQQIHFFTTTSWRNSDEFNRVLAMLDNMTKCKGDIVIGGSWYLPCWYGRGSSKSRILKEAETAKSPTQFAQNYMSKWTGSSSGALVSANALAKCRTLTTPVFSSDNEEDEYYMGVDVARSQNSANNQSSIAVFKVTRNDNNRVASIDLVNIFNVPNTLNYTAQAIIVKRTKKKYNARVVVVDGNGLGAGLVDELLKETFDPLTGESLGCWNTMNTTNEPEIATAEECVFDLKAQSYQTKIINAFIDVVGSGVLRLLEPHQYSIVESVSNPNYQDDRMPYVQTDLLFEEITNLNLVQNGKNLEVKKASHSLDKDRWAAAAYGIFYICEFTNTAYHMQTYDLGDIFTFRAPKIRR